MNTSFMTLSVTIYLFLTILGISSTNYTTTKTKQKCTVPHNGDECLVFAQQNLIVGGITATAHSWPSIAYLRFDYKTDITIDSITKTATNAYACTATLISRKILLTAGHCITTEAIYYYQGQPYKYNIVPNKYYPTVGSMYRVWLGLQDKSTIYNPDISPAVRPTIAQVIRHENYDDSSNSNDIGLIVLAEEVSLNEYIQPACLPSSKTDNFPREGSRAYTAGWGTTSSGGSTPNLLQNVQITVYDNSICPFSLLPNQICAGELSGGKDTCQGDSGGPLYVQSSLNSQTKFVLSGITSFGIGCALPNYPGAYTRVSSFINWIYKNSNMTNADTEIEQSSSKKLSADCKLFLFIYLFLSYFIK